MILCQFDDTTDASDIYDAWPISKYILRAFREKTEESSSQEKFRSQINGRVRAPTFKWVAIEKRCSKGLGILMLKKGEVGPSCPALWCKDNGQSTQYSCRSNRTQLVDKNMQFSFFFFDVGFDFQDAFLICDIHL